MITQQTETTKRELTPQEGQATARKLFVEPEISGPVNVLEVQLDAYVAVLLAGGHKPAGHRFISRPVGKQ